MTDSHSIGYGIFAGGLSSRMGSDKAFLDYAGKPMIKHMADTIGQDKKIYVSVSDTIKSNRCKDILGAGCIMLEDEIKEYGPMEGLYQLLNSCTEDALFVIAVDMPLITKEFIESVVSHYNNEDVFVLSAGERIHPLCGIYSKRILPIISDLRQQYIHKIMRIYDKCKTTITDVQKIGFSEDILVNINTKEDYERLILKR